MKISALKDVRRRVIYGLLASLAFLLILENVMLLFNRFFTDRAVLGLKLDDQNISGFKKAKIQEIIKAKINASDRPLRFTYQGKIIEVEKSQINAQINDVVLANQVIRVARDGNFKKRLAQQNRTLLGFVNIPIKGDISQASLTLKTLIIQNEVNNPAQPSRPDFLNDVSKILPAQDGIKLDTNKFTIQIADNIFNPPQDPIPLPVIVDYPSNHDPKDLETIKSQAVELTKEPITIESGGLLFTLTQQDLKALLKVTERPDPKDPQQTKLSLRLDENKLNVKLGEFAQKVEDITHAEFDDHDSRVAIYSQFYAPGKHHLIRIPTGRNLASRNVLAEKDTVGEKIAYLTFDDGPNSIYHPLILDILKSYDVKATFFLVGQNSQRNSEIAKRTVTEGHKIGNHSLTHSFLPNLTSNAILREVQLTNGILQPISGYPINLFRPPYGGVNIFVKKTSDNLGLKLTLWDVDPKDWSEPPKDELTRRIVSATHNGSDILLHSNHLATVIALPKIIETLKSQGYSFKTLD